MTVRWRVGYLAATAVTAAVDGAFLGGVAAIVTAFGSIILGVLAYRKGQANSAGPAPNGWAALVDELRRDRDRQRRRAERAETHLARLRARLESEGDP